VLSLFGLSGRDPLGLPVEATRLIGGGSILCWRDCWFGLLAHDQLKVGGRVQYWWCCFFKHTLVACRWLNRVSCSGCRGKTSSWMAFNAMYLCEQIVWRTTSWLIDKFPSRPHTAAGNKWIRSTSVALRLHLPAGAEAQLQLRSLEPL
jgi:hypothetical protein